MSDDAQDELPPAEPATVPASEAAEGTERRGSTSLLANARRWGGRLVAELAQLPDTLERLRLGAADFQLVGQRLKASSQALEELTRLYTSTLGEGVRRSADAVNNVRTQLERMPQVSPDAFSAAVSEFQKTMGAFFRGDR
jgi:hypothetical protein